MQRVSVGRGGDFATIGAALSASDPAHPLTLVLAAQVFEEKVFCEHPAVRVIGQGMDKTVIRWHDGGFHPHPDGRKTGTFRSYTACFDGKLLCMENLTVENTAGRGEQHGQAIALAVYSETAHLKNVRLKSYQDTLFMGPLPDKERQPDGFLGPRQFAPRVPSRQYYEACEILGDVDFMFGGADAVFSRCQIHAVGQRSGFAAAPSGKADGLGMVFERCMFSADEPGSLRLARPWRSEGKAAFLFCETGNALAETAFDPWAEQAQTYTFIQYPAAQTPPFCKAATEQQVRQLQAQSRAHCDAVLQKITF